MSTKITCPVCDRSAIEINICPNCQTDLALLRMLTELPPLPPIDSSSQLSNLTLVGILIGFILLGWGLWVL
jgi:hypothetical protein